MKFKIKNKTELRKQMRALSGHQYVIYPDGTWESAHEFDNPERYEYLKEFVGRYIYKGFSPGNYTTRPGHSHPYKVYCFTENNIISEFFRDVEKGCYTMEFIREVEERETMFEEERKREEEAKKEEEEKRNKALKEIPEMIDLLRRIKIQIGGCSGFDSREYEESGKICDKLLKNYEDILGKKRFLKDVYGIGE